LGVGEILDGGFATVRRHPRVVLGVSFVLGALVGLAQMGLAWWLSDVGSVLTSSAPRSSAGGETLAVTAGGVTAALISYVVSSIFAALLAGFVTVVVGKAILGRIPDGRESLRETAKRWWPLLWVSITAGGLPFAPFAAMLVIGPLGIIPALAIGVYLWGKLALTVPAFMLERRGVGASVARSWRLTQGAFWRTWGLRALTYMVARIGALVVAAPFAIPTYNALANDQSPSTTAVVMAAIGSSIAWMLTEPFVAAALTLIYVDRRMRAEALDLQLAHAAGTASTASTLP